MERDAAEVGNQQFLSACRRLDAELAFQLLSHCRAGERPIGSHIRGHHKNIARYLGHFLAPALGAVRLWTGRTFQVFGEPISEVTDANVCYWHKADVQTALMNVRYRG